MPLSNLISKIFGFLAALQFPKFIQNKINAAYVSYFNIDLSEFKEASAYESLNALFTRKLIQERKLDDGFISPSDGQILECGQSFKAKNEHFAFCIKGFTYSINELLQNSFKKEELKKGFEYINIYLSPRDYHRYHCPCDMQILSATYISGALFSVNVKYLSKIANLYTKNERVVLECKAQNSVFYLVFVGALNVGKMRFHFDAALQKKAEKNQNFTHNYEKLFFEKGAELGYFELGSTIVIIAEKDFFKTKIKALDKVQFGQSLAEF